MGCPLHLLRRYVEPGDTLALTGPVPADDLGLFWQAGQDCARLVAMAQGRLALDNDELRAIAEWP